MWINLQDIIYSWVPSTGILRLYQLLKYKYRMCMHVYTTEIYLKNQVIIKTEISQFWNQMFGKFQLNQFSGETFFIISAKRKM